MSTNTKLTMRTARHKRIRARVRGTSDRPRLAVFKSNTAVYAQIIDDTTGRTLAAADTRKMTGTRLVCATELGTAIAAKAKAAKITAVVFDRGGYRYQGAVAAVADAARAGGLTF
jgi:large subunit ribosomal protein L18